VPNLLMWLPSTYNYPTN